MHPTEVDQGVTLAGRYRVAELLAEAPGDSGVVAQTWRAVDEVLSRSVVIHLLAADDPRAGMMLEASMRAATVSDVRFLRVLDALQEDGIAYVVREWVQGRSLAELLIDGPLPPRDAGLVVREVAEALSRAHEQELFHERLDPDSVVVTDGGTIKIVGLATQAALSPTPGPPAPPVSPARADALGLGRLLYTALTARWPSGERSNLAGAPRAADGTLLSPRQCRAGVPRALDEITERILSERPRHGGPLTSPREIVDALTGTVGSTPPEGVLASSRAPAAATPFLAGPPPADQSGPPRSSGPGPQNSPGYAPGSAQSGRPGRAGRTGHGRPGVDHTGDLGLPPPHAQTDARYRPQRPPGPRWSRIAIVLVGVVLFIGVGLLGWQLVRQSLSAPPEESPSPSPTSQASSPVEQTRNAGPYALQDAGDYDPEPAGSGDEHPDEVDLVLDDDASTYWRTMEYYDPLSVQKPGVGLWVDLGADKKVGKVELTLLGQGTDLQVMAAPEGSTSAPETVDEWTEVGQESGAGKVATVQLQEQVETRFVLIWMTELPGSGSAYRGGISKIVVRP